MVDASKSNESYLSAGKYLTEGYLKGITNVDPDISKVIDSHITALYRAIGLPIEIYPNRRVEHLEKYGKKYRTRKKNSKRAMKIILGGF